MTPRVHMGKTHVFLYSTQAPNCSMIIEIDKLSVENELAGYLRRVYLWLQLHIEVVERRHFRKT
jgi:hypothetical protein